MKSLQTRAGSVEHSGHICYYPRIGQCSNHWTTVQPSRCTLHIVYDHPSRCTLYTMHCTLYTITLNAAHCTLNAALCLLHTLLRILCFWTKCACFICVVLSNMLLSNSESAWYIKGSTTHLLVISALIQTTFKRPHNFETGQLRTPVDVQFWLYCLGMESVIVETQDMDIEAQQSKPFNFFPSLKKSFHNGFVDNTP